MKMIDAKYIGLLCILLGATTVLGEDRLLSGNATYRVVGEGHISPWGEIIWVWPGTNIRPTEAGWMNNPLAEATDTGDLLIDGKTDASSVVYTPGNWTGLGKRLNVELTLPGRSRVSRVVVHLAAGPTHLTEKATLYVMGDDDLWKQVSEISPVDPKQATLTFPLAQVETGQVKLVLFNEVGPRVGLSEIEVWGDGPTESKTRGLVRMPPHLDAVRPPQPRNATPSSVLLTKPTTAVKLSGTPLTSGDAAALVDGDRNTQIRIDGDPKNQYTDRVVELEIDLGVDSFIDSVRIWMPGGKGAETGHVHDLMLAVSSGEEDNVWMVPGERVTNHYWPGDDAPKPYVIPINKVNLIGRRLRLTATLAARGALTSRLAMAEIEVFGRPAPGKIRTAVRLDQRPIEVTPEPVDIEQMHPKVRWMAEERVRSVWLMGDAFTKAAGSDRNAAQVLADAGFNMLAVSMRPDRPGDTWATGTLGKAMDTSNDIDNRLAPNLAAAKEAGLRLFVAWCYGSHHQDPYRRYRGLTTGTMAKMTCCPLDEEYIERHIGRWARAAAKGGAHGFLMDNEMYESDDANYLGGPCICDDCFMTYVKTFSKQWRFIYERLSDEARGVWLQANHADEHYARFTASRIEAQYDKIKHSCEQINPAFIMAKYHVFDDMPGLERGMGSSSIPAPLLSATEYNNGPNAWGGKLYRRAREEGFPLLYVCGAYPKPQSPEMLSNSALLSSLYYGGWFVWHSDIILAKDHPERFQGASSQDYLDRITAMHKRLDQLLTQPRSQWPDPPPLVTR
jgi:hypothetical protein